MSALFWQQCFVPGEGIPRPAVPRPEPQLGVGAFVVDKSSSIVVRLDMRARPVACVSGAIDETLASCLLARAARPTVPSFFSFAPCSPCPLPHGPTANNGVPSAPTLSGWFPAGARSRPRSRTTPNLWAAHSAQRFSRVGPAKYGFAARVSRVQEPRSGVFRSLAR